MLYGTNLNTFVYKHLYNAQTKSYLSLLYRNTFGGFISVVFYYNPPHTIKEIYRQEKIKIMNKDNSCNLIKKFSQKFINMIDATTRDGKEREVDFCQDNGNIILSNQCIGNKCSIPKSARESLKCKNGKPTIGSLHTHPDIPIFNMSMSPEDVTVAIGRAEKFSCIAYRGIAKTVSCSDYPYSVPKDEADKFRGMDFFGRESKLLENLKKHATLIDKKYYFNQALIQKYRTSL